MALFKPIIQPEYRHYLRGIARTSYIPQDKEGNVAAYGVNPTGKGQGEAIYGPVDWEQFFPTWDTVGQEYKEESWKTRHGWKPMVAKHMKFLEDRGFRFIKKLGKGGFGEVWKVRATKLREAKNAEGKVINVPIDLACKIVELKSFTKLALPDAIQRLKEESELHKTLRHTNIVDVEMVFHVEDTKSGFPQPIKVCIFMELCNGDLSSLIKSSVSGLSEKETQQWFRDIVFGLRYLHDMDLAHLDIKPHNILYKVESDGSTVFKLADFGLTYDIQSGPLIFGRCGTRGYMAPEMGQAGGVHPKPCDIYSLGVTLSMSLTGNGDIVVPLIASHVTPQLITTLSQQYSMSELLVDLIARMVIDPAHRGTVENIIQHDWFIAVLP